MPEIAAKLQQPHEISTTLHSVATSQVVSLARTGSTISDGSVWFAFFDEHPSANKSAIRHIR